MNFAPQRSVRGWRMKLVLACLAPALTAAACDRRPSPTTAPASPQAAETAGTGAVAANPTVPPAEPVPAQAALAPAGKPLRIALPGPDRAGVLAGGSKIVVVGGDRATLAIRVGPYYVSTVSAADGKPLQKFDFKGNPVAGFVPAGDGRHVLFWGAYPQRVMRVPPFALWDVEAGTVVSRFGEDVDYGTAAAAITPDASRVVSAGGKQPVRLWDARTGTKLAEFETNRHVYSVGISKDADAALLGGGEDDESVTLVDLATGRELLSLTDHRGVVTSVEFSPDGTKLLSASADGTIRLWDRKSGRELRRLRSEVGVASAEFDPTGQTVLARTITRTWTAPNRARVLQVNDVRVWDLASGALRARFADADRQDFTSAGFASGGREIVATSDNHHVHRWALPESPAGTATASLDEPLLPSEVDPQRFVAKMDRVLSVGYLANGDAFAATEGNTVARWDVAQKERIGMYATAVARQLQDARSVSSDGRLAVAVSRLSEKKAVVWELASGLAVTEPEVDGRVNGAAFLPDASLVAVGVIGNEPVDNELAFFRTTDGSPAGKVAVPGCGVEQIALSHDGATVAVIGDGETSVEVFALDTAKQVKKLVAPNNTRVEEIAFSGDGSRILASNFETVVVWDVASGRMVFHQQVSDDITTAAISPNGKRLLIADKESNLSLWDVDRKKLVTVLDHHRLSVTSVAFSPDGKTAFSASRDETVRAWDLPQ